MSFRMARPIVLCLTLVALSPRRRAAQVSTGRIDAPVVTDSTGAVLPGVTCGHQRSTESDRGNRRNR